MSYEREPWEFEESRKQRKSSSAAVAAAGGGIEFFGANPTATEAASGRAVGQREEQQLRQGSVGHRALTAFESGERLTAYDASVRKTGDFHAIRREATRLVERGFLVKDGTLPNHAPRGRSHVDAYRLTEAGRVELQRLGEWP